jgi:HD-like signal output (HDOD) protein
MSAACLAMHSYAFCFGASQSCGFKGNPPFVDLTVMDSPRASEFASTFLRTEQIEFLKGLTVPPPAQPIAHFDGHDLQFLGGIAKRMRGGALQIAMLPDASLRLSELLRQGDRPIAQYVDLISKDAALSVEVLRVANSAAYATAARTSSLQEAVLRVGLARLQSVLMVTLMRSRVLKLGALQSHADACLELAMPIGYVASAVARLRRKPTDACFVRGMLLHVEHLLILGLVPEIGRDTRTVLTVSPRAVLQAFVHFGRDIRQTAAKAWNLADLMTAAGDADDTDYALLRMAIVSRWLGGPIPAIAGIAPDALQAVMNEVPLRMTPEFLEQQASGDGVSDADREWLSDFLRTREAATAR